MCRNIKMLYNLEPRVSEYEIQASAMQFVRNVSGFSKPSSANKDAFDGAIDEIAQASSKLLGSLVTTAPPKTGKNRHSNAHPRALFTPGSQQKREI